LSEAPASTPSAEPILRLRGVGRRFGGLHAVREVDLAVVPGERRAILGPNGAGKTTTLEMIEGLRRPDAGEVEVLGQPVWPDPRSIQGRIGVQLQSTSLFEMLTARELLILFARFYDRKDGAERAARALALVGLEAKAESYAGDMSGGQQQRLAIALALVHDPDVVFLDEPTTGLDPQARRNLWDVIRAVNQKAGKTVVLTTHYLEEAEALCDEVALIRAGRLISRGTAAGLRAEFGATDLTEVYNRAMAAPLAEVLSE
jgi:ABC-2 type transport system ATP-binding protein